MTAAAHLLGFLLLRAAPDAVAQKPSAAIFTLGAETGVAPSTAKVVTEQLVARVRQADVFSRVVTDREAEAVLGFEAQKQLVDCSADSCMAQRAGSLGVDFLMTGNLARIGASSVFTVKLLDVRTALARAAVSQRLKGDTEELLLDAVEPVVRELLTQARLGVPAPAVGRR